LELSQKSEKYHKVSVSLVMVNASFKSKQEKKKMKALSVSSPGDIMVYDADRGADTEEESGEVAQEQFLEFEKKLKY